MDTLQTIFALVGLIITLLGVCLFVAMSFDTNSKVTKLLDAFQAEEDEETDEDGKEPE